MTLEWAKPAAAGFLLIAARQWSYLAWCAALFVCVAGSFAAAVALAGGINAPGVSSPAGARNILLMAAVCAAVLGAPIVCAIYRAVLRPEESRFAYVRLGATELRMIAVLAPFAAAMALVAELAAAAAHWRLAVIFATLLAATPLTLAGPAVFSRGLRGLGDALTLGRRYYWELAGVNVLTWLLLLIMIFTIQIGWKLFAGSSESDLVNMLTGHPDPVFQGQMVLASCLAWLLYSAAVVVALAPAADAYRRLAGSGAPQPDAMLGSEAQA